MADKKPAPKSGGKGAPVKKGKSYKAGAVYEIAGTTIKRARRTCPKCGPGIYLGKHANRQSCGKCGYTEMG
jgi:small subunit ribosomal protein S27Ae